ncbi:MAG: DeoR/GlpR family DNA-binding transcription regulator [Flavobacteriaceae bacterium]|nr:DeoR/GlpR family DNA-binding transcription regulator [Flavobacteriaceae bacterium]
MLKQERHQVILKKIKKNRKVLSNVLSKELFVSEDTVRRDLKELELKKLLHKVHGGALSIESKILTYDERSIADIDKKKIIAKKAVKLIHDGQVIIMSGSTTNLELAKIIPENINATVFTYSLPIALELTYHPSVEVIFIGGKLNKDAQVTTGIDVVNLISKIRADICFMGTGGINIKRGMTEPNWEVSHIKKCMIEASDYVVAMCISTKVMDVKRFSVVPLRDIDTIITDFKPNNPIFNEYVSQGITVI